MTPAQQRALHRIVLAERQLAEFDRCRDPNNAKHERTLRKLRLDLECAESDAAHLDRMCDG